MRGAFFAVRSFFVGTVVLALVTSVSRGESPTSKPVQPQRQGARPLNLASYQAQDPSSTSEKTTVTTRESSDSHWEINGPVFLRSADPEPPGEVVIKNIFSWEHSKESEGEDRDEYEYELEIEWGIVENHELIFEFPWQIGEGRIDGNGDITMGWHWRLWDERDDLPAFALRNFVRVPSGVDSSGVDYELRGLLSKTIVPGSTRLHLNPFARSVNGDNDEEAEDFQYGAAFGMDYRISDDLLFITDYIYSSEESESAERPNHSAEFGIDWKLDERQKIGVSFLVGLDGDDDGAEFGASISYMLGFGG